MYGKEYLEWKETRDAWESLRQVIEAELAGIDEEIRPAVLRKMRAKYAIENVDTSLLEMHRQSAFRNVLVPEPFTSPLRNPFGWPW